MHILVKLAYVGVAFLWSTTSSVYFIREMVPEGRKILAMYPYWNQHPEIFDPYEMNKAVLDATQVLPGYEKVIRQPQQQNPQEESAEAMAGVGGMASGQDMTQSSRSTQNSTMPSNKRSNAIPSSASV